MSTPHGAQTRSKSPAMFPASFPQRIVKGEGARVWDEQGKEYLDWICGLGAITLGYQRNDVDEAVIEQIRESGTIFSLPHPLEEEVSELVCQVVPCAESVRWVNSGTEASEGAMRIARLATGKDVILLVGYHGWSSAPEAAKPEHPGVPDGYTSHILEFAFNDDAIVQYLDAYGATRIAAVFIEPVLLEAPKPGYLETLRRACTRYGCVLIFDEVICAPRWALGGAQVYFNVKPDLATFSKGIGNGYTVACIAGQRDLMRHAWYVSGTYGGSCVGLTAVKATIGVYLKEPVIDRLWSTGQRLMDGFTTATKKHGGLFRIEGYPVQD